jgi:NAD(P)-dependent dehydrogenase (short-subunit alcohol dehydrogenase family)
VVKVLLVTGGGNGIGAAVCLRAAADGWAVAVNYVRDAESAAAVVAGVEALGGKAVAVRGDVSDEADVVRMFAETSAALGPVTGLVNNAGITGLPGRVDELSTEMLRRVLEVNFVGTVFTCREAVRSMSTKHGGSGGVIVNVSSRAAEIGSAGEWVHYAAGKAAVNTFTVGLAKEVALEGIRVACVAPGLTDTRAHAEAGMPDRLERMAPGVPMGRAGSAAEVAEGVVWLLSDAASYVTGTVLDVSGGR